jgi:hypothetical protein
MVAFEVCSRAGAEWETEADGELEGTLEFVIGAVVLMGAFAGGAARGGGNQFCIKL